MTTMGNDDQTDGSTIKLDNYRSKPAATAGWLVAGIPLLATIIQAIGALTSEVNTWPIVGPLTELVHSVEVFRVASLEFLEASDMIMALFFMFFIAWIGLGLSLFRPMTLIKDNIRNLRRVSAFASTVMFSGLFIVVYQDILFGSFPVSSKLLLLAIPIPTLVGIYIAYRLQPKTNSQQLLDEAESTLQRKSTDFMSRLDSELDHRYPDVKKEFASLSSDAGFVNANSGDTASKTFVGDYNKFDEVNREIAHLRTASISENEREEDARDILQEHLSNIDPETEIKQIRKIVGEKLAERLEKRFVGFNVKSDRWGREYNLVNHDEYCNFRPSVADTEYHEFSPVHIDKISAIVADFSSEPSGTIGAMIGLSIEIEDHFEFVTDDLEEREEKLATEQDEIIEVLDDIKKDINDVDGDTGARLNQLLIKSIPTEKQGKELILSSGSDGKLDTAIESHHDCLFGESKDALKEAWDLTEELRDAVTFITQLITVIDDQGKQLTVRGVSLTSNRFLEDVLLDDQFQRSLQHDYSCEIDVDRVNEVVQMSYSQNSSQSSPTVDDDVDDLSDTEGIDKHRIQSGAEHVLRAILQGDLNTGDSSDRHNVVQTDNIPAYYAIPSVVQEVKEFLEQQGELVENVELQDDAPPGYLEFDFTSDSPPEVAKKTLLNRYTDRMTIVTNR